MGGGGGAFDPLLPPLDVRGLHFFLRAGQDSL